tara:strand:+ start:521 stop:1312 length:792 start_codon:yes stop_codon:yes gene_type:complete
MLDKSFNFLKPFEVDDLIRLGRKEDGGYIISEKVLKNCNILISFGMANDWSFEQDFLNYNKENKVYIYDHTVNLIYFLKRFYKSLKRLFYLKSSPSNINTKLNELIKYLKIDKKKFIHIKKKVDIINSNFQVDIKKIFSITNNKKIILKIDIEGDEYKIFDEILNFSNQIETFLVEFHEIEKNRDEFISIIQKIQKNYFIIHLHANNITGYCNDNLPKTIEFTFLKKNNLKLNLKNINSYPIKNLDYPNHPYIKDIDINFSDK